jgi:hypothetical protein
MEDEYAIAGSDILDVWHNDYAKYGGDRDA